MSDTEVMDMLEEPVPSLYNLMMAALEVLSNWNNARSSELARVPNSAGSIFPSLSPFGGGANASLRRFKVEEQVFYIQDIMSSALN